MLHVQHALLPAVACAAVGALAPAGNPAPARGCSHCQPNLLAHAAVGYSPSGLKHCCPQQLTHLETYQAPHGRAAAAAAAAAAAMFAESAAQSCPSALQERAS
jgi:hypothetical protein